MLRSNIFVTKIYTPEGEYDGPEIEAPSYQEARNWLDQNGYEDAEIINNGKTLITFYDYELN
jgi:hypothetical protein